VNYELISIVVFRALLLMIGVALVADAGVRTFRSILINLHDRSWWTRNPRRDFLTQCGADKSAPCPAKGNL